MSPHQRSSARFLPLAVAAAIISFPPARTAAQLIAPRGIYVEPAVPPAPSVAPGGFIETATSRAVRPVLTASQIQALLPARGAFAFPAPYLTQGVRITNDSDCGGLDCVIDAGYSYWRNMNNHAGSDTMYVFLTLARSDGAGGPTLFTYNKTTHVVTKVGPLFNASSALSWASGEGWYFSATQPTALYLNDGPALKRYDVLTRQMQTVFDVSTQPGLFGANRFIWQLHSSNDDRVHSGTLKDGSSYAALGCFAYREDTSQFFYFPRVGDYDECQIDKSGRWLVIKENVDGSAGEDNRIIDLSTGVETRLLDQHGAGGHSDTGSGYFVASDNWDSRPNAIKVWQFGQTPLQGTLVYHGLDWGVSAPNHVSHANAAGSVAAQQYACGSGANRINSTRANEIMCFPLDGSMRVLIVAPVMTDLNAAGGGDDYRKLPKGNLDVTGQYFLWTSNLGGGRLDAFIVRVPGHLLINSTPSPASNEVVADAPTGLAASVTGHTVSLTWTAPSVAPAAYVFEVGTAPGLSNLANFPIGGTMPWFVTSGLGSGRYYARVRAATSAGRSAASNEVSFAVGRLACTTTAPLAPVRLQASVNGGVVTLTWSPPAGGSDPSAYRIEAGSEQGLANLAAIDTGSTATTFTAIARPGTYYVRAHARNTCGSSAPTGEVTVIVRP